jgi:hypothetical protein
MPNTLLRERFRDYLEAVQTLADAGIPPPKAWTELRDRYEAYRHLDMPACSKLIDAVIAPAKTTDVTTWHALSIAERVGHTMTGIQADIDQAVAAAVEQRLRELYAPAAAGNYDKAAARFDTAAAAFTAAATTTDVEADAAEMVKAPDDQRDAWLEAERYAAELDSLVPLLTVAAQLAGVDVNPDDGTELTMCANPTDAHRRPLWTAWSDKQGRTGRWGQLAKIGAQIRSGSLGDITPYRRPRDIETRQVPVPGQVGIYQFVTFDPETDEPPAEPEKVMIPGTRFGGR